MNPPIRQKLIHHRPLGREHIRILLLLLRLALRGRQSRSIVHRLAEWTCPRRVDEAGWVRRRAEFVWLCEDAALVRVGFGFCGCGAGGGERGGERVSGGVCERAECLGGEWSPGEEERRD